MSEAEAAVNRPPGLTGVELALQVGERYPVKERQHQLTPRLAAATAAAREVLVDVAKHRETITYGELSEAIGGAVLPRHLGPLLWMLGHDCAARDEPNLPALVVSAATGEVGTSDTRWATPARQACWEYWAK
ncbi:Uncharacterised protein [Actinomyces bovis]|uniref:Uncharacterized protein n=1 Tax=Actinomyces bovis TaxID=1658 RepID=A0ABY1VPX4_9ACTO|nr:hypothetical protein [Actinomyces bovis]SPT53691.1 Uncharacterised protein [Actinomyces bovis]VEG55812.1 Uncharacterised protein [Actinomyces israelii]